MITIGTMTANSKDFLSTIYKYTESLETQPITPIEISIFYTLVDTEHIVYNSPISQKGRVGLSFKGLWLYFLLKKGILC